VDLTLSLTSVFTVSTWVNFRGAGGVQRDYLVIGTCEFYFDPSTESLSYWNGGLTGSGSFGSAFPKNSWQHVVFVNTGSSLSAYRNGEQAGSEISSSVVSGCTSPTGSTFGSYSDGTQFFFPGQIDDVRIYNRALSAQEVKRLYNMGGTLHVGASQNQKLTNGLVGLWSFGQPDLAGVIAYDRSGNANNGTITNGPKQTIGKIGQALSFDGNGDYVSVANESNFDFVITSSFSISAWFYRKSNGTEDDIFVKVDPNTSFQGYSLALLPSGGPDVDHCTNCVAFQIRDGAGNNLNVQSPVSSFSTNTWVHAVVTYNGNLHPSGVKMYLNGVSQTITTQQDALAGTVTNNNAPLIGIDATNGGTDTMDGYIDEVRIYNRALSAQEVTRLYNMGHTGP